MSLKRSSRYVDFPGSANFAPISLNYYLRDPLVLFIKGSQGEGYMRGLNSLKEYKYDHYTDKQVSRSI